MRKGMLFKFICLLSVCGLVHANDPLKTQPESKVSIVGGGIIGAFESYYAYQDALKDGEPICIVVYEKGSSFGSSTAGKSSTNTAFNIVPSLTIDEILSVVPRGNELVDKLGVLFSQPGGIRVDDVAGVNDSVSAIQFKEAVTLYGSDKQHDDRTHSLLKLGKKSMELWEALYKEGDAELKAILEASNFNSCHEPTSKEKVLHDGYRIDLICGIPAAEERALAMKRDYQDLGYQHCALLSPDEVVALDPYLSDFCQDYSELDETMNRVWKKDSAALWRPGGCIDTVSFLPKFYAYLKKKMGQYEDVDGNIQDCFQLRFGKEVTGVALSSDGEDPRVVGLTFSDGETVAENARYVFCPGEAVGTLANLGFDEPSYAAFAGPSLLLSIPLAKDQIEKYRDFSHCMEVHNVGIVLAWQARFKDDGIFIGVAGTKAFYGDKQPDKQEDFAKNRNLVQLNMVNQVLPEFITLGLGSETHGKTLTADDLAQLESQGIARRWVGRRAVAYDGFPTLGALYSKNRKVTNARCTTHLGSGGVSFGPAAVFVSRSSETGSDDAFIQKILQYGDSTRIAQ
jgi:hypothetical protein